MRVVLGQLASFHRGQLFDGGQAAVFGEGHGNVVESIGEGSKRVLLRAHLVCGDDDIKDNEGRRIQSTEMPDIREAKENTPSK